MGDSRWDDHARTQWKPAQPTILGVPQQARRSANLASGAQSAQKGPLLTHSAPTHVDGTREPCRRTFSILCLGGYIPHAIVGGLRLMGQLHDVPVLHR